MQAVRWIRLKFHCSMKMVHMHIVNSINTKTRVTNHSALPSKRIGNVHGFDDSMNYFHLRAKS